MSEEKRAGTIKDAADATRGILEAVPAYQDAIQPAARELGRSIEVIAKTVRVALAPLSALVWGYDQISDYLDRRLSERFRNIPRERIQTPRASVAGPAVEALRFSAQDPDLREMYAKLLGTAMDRNTATLAHPAFVETIRQLSPDEARILTHMAEDRYGPVPTVFLLTEMKSPTFPKGGYLTLRRNVSMVAEQARCEDCGLCAVYLDNLSRLGLVEILRGRCGNVEAVEGLHKSPSVAKHLSDETEHFHPFIRDYTIKFTDFGQQFLDACVLEPKETSDNAR